MLKNYLATTLKALRRNGVFTFVTISGLEQTTENKDFEETNVLFVDSTFHKLLTT